MSQPSLINIHPNEYSQCNTLNDLSNKVCIPNKIEHYLNLIVLNIVTEISESKTLYHVNVTVNLMVENVIQIKSGIMINVNESEKNIICVEKFMFGILLHVVARMVNT